MKTKKRELPDCRGLVSRTPPDGLAAWAYRNDGKLHRAGLLYEVEWVSEMCLEALLSKAEAGEDGPRDLLRLRADRIDGVGERPEDRVWLSDRL